MIEINWDSNEDEDEFAFLHAGHTYTCDNCGEGEDIEGMDFKEVVDLLKRSGWLTKKESGVWFNYCPNCIDDVANKSAIDDFE